MTGPIINEQIILEELRQVPQDRWADVQAYLRALRSEGPSSTGEKRLLTAADLLHSGLVGLWADRTNLGDTREFARGLREQAQTRERDE